MTFAKENLDEYPQLNLGYFTEKAIYMALSKKGLEHKRDFEFHIKINNVPFNKNKKHEVDLVLTSQNGDRLYVEIKGQMTYLEVNKLKFLLERSEHFYILQLTEIDWIRPFNKEKEKEFEKSKNDFEKQINELVMFVNNKKTGEELSEISKKRLERYIKYRSKDLDRWKTDMQG